MGRRYRLVANPLRKNPRKPENQKEETTIGRQRGGIGRSTLASEKGPIGHREAMLGERHYGRDRTNLGPCKVPEPGCTKKIGPIGYAR